MRCSRCIMPSTTPDIQFDEAGACSYCHSYRGPTLLGEESLLEIIRNTKANADEFDCIVNISGGRDSSFTVLKMAKDYGLRVLAVNYHNPFTHPLARENIENIKKILGLKLVSFGFRRGYHENLLKRNLLTLLKKPDPAMVPMVCISCKLIWQNILAIARSYHIRMIVSGGNLYEQSSFKRILLGGDQSQSVTSYYTKYIAGLVRHSLGNLGYLRPQTIMPTIKGYLFGNPYSPMVRILGRGITKIDLFHYLDWDEHSVLKRIQNELEWHFPENGTGSWRFDCRIGHLKDYFYSKWLGLTEKDDFYSNLIRVGKISREEALARIDTENRINIDEIGKLMESVGLNLQVLE